VLLTLVLPYLVVLIFVLFAHLEGERFLGRDEASSWPWLLEVCFVTWSTLFLPLFVFLGAALVAAIEHRAQGFRLMLTLPVARWRVYLGKEVAVMLLVAGSFFFLAIGVLLGGGLLRAVHPGLGFEAAFPVAEVLLATLWGTCASTFLVAIATWVSLWSRSFVLPVALGLVATVLLLALRSAGLSLALYHPAAYAVEAVLAAPGVAVRWAALGLGTGVAFSLASIASLAGRDVE